MVTNLWPEEGSHRGIFVERFVESIRRRGHLVDVEVVAQGRGRSDYLLAIRRVRRRARAGSYDLVHVHFGMTALAARFVGRPRVLSLYGSDVNVRWKRWLTRLGWGGTRARIYVSPRLAQAAGDAAGHVIPNGVDFDRFRPGDRISARAALGFAPDDRVVLFGSDPLRRVKGHDLFSEVLNELHTRGVQVRELVLTEPGLSTEDLVTKLDAADVLLFTSQQGSEGSPTVVKEALAMGLPVVSTDVGDVHEMLRGVEPSAVVPFSPHESTHPRHELVRALANGAAEVLESGRRSNGRVVAGWLALDRIAERVEDVYRSILSQ